MVISVKNKLYRIENIKDFDMIHIFECGQCFRWNKVDETYIGVIGNNVLSVKKDGKDIIFEGNCSDNIENLVKDYFDFDTDYAEIKRKLSKIDDNMKKSIEYGNGIRILNQDLWECIISFIISANNNIPRIKKIIERLSKAYGKKVSLNGVDYYTFPTPEELSKASVEDLRALGLGFRDKRVYDTTQLIHSKEFDLEKLKKETDSEVIREKLLTLPGVGPKVADCIMLFSLKRFEVFPIDVWVRRVMNELYIGNPDETRVGKKEIESIAKEKYANLAGIAQQYLFYWKREA